MLKATFAVFLLFPEFPMCFKSRAGPGLEARLFSRVRFAPTRTLLDTDSSLRLYSEGNPFEVFFGTFSFAFIICACYKFVSLLWRVSSCAGGRIDAL